MHYKIVAISFLISGSLLAVENKKAVALSNDKTSQAARIKELETKKIKIETDAAELGERIVKESAKFACAAVGAQQCWRPSSGRNDEIAFGKFILNLCDMFERGEDIEQVVSESIIYNPLMGPTFTESVQLLFLAAVMQQSHLKRLADEFKSLGKEKLAINKELYALKAAQK